MGLDFRFHYNRGQDRIAISAADSHRQTAVLWMTRFLAGRFLEALGAVISKTSPTIPFAPGHASEVLGFEHEQAVVQAESDGRLKVEPGNLPIDPSPKLVETIQFLPLADGRLRLTFLARKARLSLDLTREVLHVVHAQVLRLAQHAGWGLEVSAPWEAPPTPAGEPPSRTQH